MTPIGGGRDEIERQNREEDPGRPQDPKRREGRPDRRESQPRSSQGGERREGRPGRRESYSRSPQGVSRGGRPMAQRWAQGDDLSRDRIRSWTPIEKAERVCLLSALAEVLTLPTRQIDYRRAADLLGISHSTLISKLFQYGIPCPAVARKLQPDECERIVEIKKAHRENHEQLAQAVATFIREVLG